MRHLLSFMLLFVVFTSTPHFAYAEQELSIEALGNLVKGGDAAAQYEMGTRYISGKGVEKNVKQAIELFKKSASQDYTKSLFILGKLYMDGIYIKKSDKKAMEWYEKAARKGHGNAQYSLALLYARYKNSKELLMKSYAWLDVVARRGLPKAASRRDELAKRMDYLDLIQARRVADEYYESYVEAYEEDEYEDEDEGEGEGEE